MRVSASSRDAANTSAAGVEARQPRATSAAAMSRCRAIDMMEDAKHFREQLIEKVSEADDKILEKYLHGEDISEAEIKAALRKRVNASVHSKDEKSEPAFVPVICGSAFKNKGVQPLLDAVVDYLPSPLDIPPVKGVDPEIGRAHV